MARDRAEAAARERAKVELLQYQQQIQEAEAQLLSTQQAFQQLRLGHQQGVGQQGVGQQGVGQQTHGQTWLRQPERQSILRQSISHPQVAQQLGTVIRETQPILHSEIVIGTDGRRYTVPRSQLTQVPEVEIVTGADGRRYKVYKSNMIEDLPVTQQHQQMSQCLDPNQYTRQRSPHEGVLPPQGRQGISYPWQTQPAQPRQPMLPTQYLQAANPQQQAASAERMQGILNITDVSGARKPDKLLDFVKKCPAKWCKNVKQSNMNLPVYGYGAVAELVASLSGRADPLPEAVLLAKLKHLQNVFKVCCINSTETDLCSYGWTLAKDYSLKVQEKVDQQLVSWETISQGIQTDVLVSSQMEFPRPAKEKEPTKNGSDGDRPPCSTINIKCTTEGKCEFEVRNPGRNCLRRHECSWCRKNKNQLRKHQELKCASKLAADK